MNRAELRAALWLAVTDRMNVERWQALGLLFPSPLSLWEHFDESSVGPALYRALGKKRDPDALDLMIDRMEGLGIRLVWFEDKAYPPLLRQIDDPPLALFVRGEAELTGSRQFAVVGSRACTRYGRAQTAAIVKDLAQAGVLVVSGLAYGIDAAANRAAAEAGKPTVAVLGHGLDIVYPEEHRDLAELIVQTGGALVSEYAPGVPVKPYHFPQRNRIISGMCSGLLLVEANKRSGSMITVRLALEQGREVFALPGPVDVPTSYQPLRLLRDGAGLVTSAQDILSDMHWLDLTQPPRFAPPADFRLPQGLGPEQEAIVGALLPGPLPFAQLLENTGLAVAQLNSHLTMLEIEEIIEQLPGRVYALLAQSGSR